MYFKDKARLCNTQLKLYKKCIKSEDHSELIKDQKIFYENVKIRFINIIFIIYIKL